MAALLGLILVLLLGLYGIGASGIGTERLRFEAEAALRRAAGPGVAAAIGPARISLDGSRFLALNISDVRVSTNGAPQVEAGTLQFGVRLLPLLSGDFRLGSAKISDARISVPALLFGRTGDWTGSIRNEDGLIDPDLAGEALFRVLHHALDTLERGGTRRIDLANTELVLADTGRIRSLVITEASLADDGRGILTLSATGSLDGRAMSLTGTAAHEGGDRRISSVELNLAVAPAEPLVLDASGMLSPDGSKSRLGAAEVKITGSEGVAGNPSRLALEVHLDNSIIDMGKRGVVPADADIDATLEVGANKIEIDKLLISTGRSRIEATGAVGPKPREAGSSQGPVYRYEFVTDRALLSPIDSPEAPIEFFARMAGHFDEATMLLSADELAVRTGEGELAGVASVEFVRGKTPGLALAVSASEMPVAHVKQFWPWLAAGKARQWALANLFGGRMMESQVRYRVPPGRIGDGVPLNGDEISGRFVVADSRFDTTGELPPIRDAGGVIEFRGNDVDISLSSGVAFLPSGKQVDLSNGVLTFRNAHIQPVVGDLALDIKGDAAAVAELGSLDPIDAMRRLGMAPADFSGTVTGHVKTQLPLQKSTDLKSLKWKVDLKVSQLALAKPLEGQKLTNADGTIVVDPGKAVVELDGRLNGVPAELSLVEPLGPDPTSRRREISLTVNDENRNKIAPGLDGLVSGTMVIKVDASAPDKPQSTKADLTKAKLNIPWVGWSKGAGVPANVSFNMAADGGKATLSKFELSGETFAIGGEVKLAEGALASAQFDKVRLNRGDSARVDVSRQGKGYAVTVKGESFDGRSLIKLVLGDAGAGQKGTEKGPTVSVKAAIDRLAGFHGETLSNVQLTYRGAQGGDAIYSLSAATRGGGAVSVKSGVEDGRQVMRVQSADAGSFVRFLDIYEHMQGGEVDLVLRGQNSGSMRGQVNATKFDIVNEERLGSIVSTKPDGSDRSLNQAVRRDIDTARVQFQRGFAAVEKGDGYLKLDGGVLRGPMIGATFQGTLYDQRGNIDMTGTFMPAYGLNRLFGELPIIGVLLGNGRDRGLIGVTFKLAGKASKPQLQINPLSVIAPGIFRQIFEFQ
ncbi:DUF3971 domain-containing protein [Arvimicrobium flavum]|uniref:YhdP family protein n=1 Tax=Arvimicrobium flavum TaxID=3393320 RepID=UPI00237C14DE|nr:AsmA-like C-terminal region-containing protein [Mesorhizobium shangrilense]